MHWSRGAIQKYAMHHDTAVVHMVRSSKYYLHGSFAGAGKGYSPVKLDMCACVLRHPAYLSLCVASATHKFVVQQPQPARQSPPLRCGYACKSVFAQAVWPQMPHVSSSSYSCNNTLGFPAEITLDDVQYLLYGKDVGLSLPFRDRGRTCPWSRSVKPTSPPWTGFSQAEASCPSSSALQRWVAGTPSRLRRSVTRPASARACCATGGVAETKQAPQKMTTNQGSTRALLPCARATTRLTMPAPTLRWTSPFLGCHCVAVRLFYH